MFAIDLPSDFGSYFGGVMVIFRPRSGGLFLSPTVLSCREKIRLNTRKSISECLLTTASHKLVLAGLKPHVH